MIALEVTSQGIDRTRADLVVWFAFAGDAAPARIGNARLRAALKRLMTEEKFNGRKGQAVVLSGASGLPARRYAVVGLGKKGPFSPGALRDAAASAARRAEDYSAATVAIAFPPAATAGLAPAEQLQAIAEGVLLGNYKFDTYLTEKARKARPLRKVTILHTVGGAEAKSAFRLARITSAATCLARDLVCEPAGVLNPEEMTRRARAVAKEKGIAIEVLGKKELAAKGMGAFLGVNAGSAVPPQLIHLTWKPKAAKKRVALVGKGITFDSGGINLKPTGSIETMKCDMAGSAAVLATVAAAADLELPVEVHGFMAMTENMPGGHAQKPGDVVRTMSGKTVEINNTDAEGRLVLCDSLAWAQTFNPDVIVDLATLTGACVVALGPLGTGVMGNSEALVGQIVGAARRTGEKMWPLPLYDEYLDMLRSEIADMQNSGGRWGGAITAGLFLREFVNDKTPWAHLDIAGPAFAEKDQPLSRAGGTGAGVRTLIHWLSNGV